MSKLRVHSFAVSIDGYGAGPKQSLENPLGVGGTALHEWAFATRTIRQMFGSDGGTTGVDDDFAARGFAHIGAWILGRNMFGPVRGPWPDDTWKGWWGDNPPYHTPVFVLTHHARAPIAMEGGTTFHFVTDGIHAALDRARQTAEGRDVRLGGGVATIQQYLRAGLVDEMHLAVGPDPAGLRRALVHRHRPAGARLSVRRTCLHSKRHACRSDQARKAEPGVAQSTRSSSASWMPDRACLQRRANKH